MLSALEKYDPQIYELLNQEASAWPARPIASSSSSPSSLSPKMADFSIALAINIPHYKVLLFLGGMIK